MHQPKEIAMQAASALIEKKGIGIQLLDVADLTTLADYFLICTGTSAIHVNTLCDAVEKAVADDLGEPLLHREGHRSGTWVLLDFGSLIVHVFTEETRKFYDLEHLWSDAAPVNLDALEKAVLETSQNITGFDEDTRVLLACDVSGSMCSPISPKSSVKNYDIGLMLAMLLKNRCENVVCGIFGTDWKVINLPSTSILNNVDLMYKREGEVGYATNGFKVIEYLSKEGIVMDKVMMFTDNQMWNSNGTSQTMRIEWNKYKKIAPNAHLYLFDLSGYGTTPLSIVRDDVFLIAGWSDRIFEMLFAIEKGANALVEIRKIEF